MRDLAIKESSREQQIGWPELQNQALALRAKYDKYQKTHSARTRLELIDEIGQSLKLLDDELLFQRGERVATITQGKKLPGQYELFCFGLKASVPVGVFAVIVVVACTMNLIPQYWCTIATISFGLVYATSEPLLDRLCYRGFLPSDGRLIRFFLRWRIARSDESYISITDNIRNIRETIKMLRKMRFRLYLT